jgi:hypothetical protein
VPARLVGDSLPWACTRCAHGWAPADLGHRRPHRPHHRPGVGRWPPSLSPTRRPAGRARANDNAGATQASSAAGSPAWSRPPGAPRRVAERGRQQHARPSRARARWRRPRAVSQPGGGRLGRPPGRSPITAGTGPATGCTTRPPATT